VNTLLVNIALLLCPSDFRYGFREFRKTTVEPREGTIAAVLDIAATGLTLRWEMIQRDISQAARSLLKAPLFTLVAVLAIALSVGANLIVAGVLDAVVLQPLPFPQPSQLLFVQATGNGFGNSMAYPEARNLRERMHQIGDLALWTDDTRTLYGRGHAVAVQGARISSNYFTTLGVHPALGRLLDGPATKSDVVISYDLWQSRFGGDSGVLGKSLRLNDDEYHIVGVAPYGLLDPTVYGLLPLSYWLPIDTRDPKAVGEGHFNYEGIARVHSGLNVDRASHDIVQIVSAIFEKGNLGRKLFDTPGEYDPEAQHMQDVIVGPIRPLLWTLYAAVTLVLLIACTNVANLHVSRHVAREGRFALLSALGATHRRIAIELATETALLAVVGGAAGLGMAWFGLDGFSSVFGSLISTQSPRFHLDGPTLIYAVLLVPFITIVSGLIPALTQRRNLVASLRSTTQAGTRRFANQVRSGLVVVEVALAMALAICAGLVLHSFFTLTNVALGFQPTNIAVVYTDVFENPRYAGDAAKRAWVRKTVTALAAIPGVTSASSASLVPFTGNSSIGISFPGRPTSTTDAPSASINVVMPEYFRTMQIALVRGRLLTDSDRSGAPAVAVVDTTFARQFFGSLDVIRHKFIQSEGGSDQPTTIVGVVGNVRLNFGARIQPAFYLAQEQFPSAKSFVIRTDQPIANLAASVDAAFDRVDSSIPPPPVYPITYFLAARKSFEQTSLLLFAILAGIALLLSITGVYAVSSNSVEQRRREFGIRKALGATTGAVLRTVVIASLRTSAIGVGIGIILTAAASRFLGALLYQTSPWDPVTFISAAALFLFCAVFSAFIPALRAMRVEPAVALRSE
jgi:putative ABC transport system permease protein